MVSAADADNILNESVKVDLAEFTLLTHVCASFWNVVSAPDARAKRFVTRCRIVPPTGESDIGLNNKKNHEKSELSDTAKKS